MVRIVLSRNQPEAQHQLNERWCPAEAETRSVMRRRSNEYLDEGGKGSTPMLPKPGLNKLSVEGN
jgi:hypothetical protein